jgi:hypothetical protein
MGAEQKKVVIWSWVIAGLVMMIASTWDAIIVGWVVYQHPSVNVSVLNTIEPARTEFRRKEQRYFLESGIYIPLEDIMFVDQLAKAGKSYSKALKENCSDLNDERGLAIWLPLKIKIPLLGERVQEWCWRPNLQS